jgi:hypothetical protein
MDIIHVSLWLIIIFYSIIKYKVNNKYFALYYFYNIVLCISVTLYNKSNTNKINEINNSHRFLILAQLMIVSIMDIYIKMMLEYKLDINSMFYNFINEISKNSNILIILVLLDKSVFYTIFTLYYITIVFTILLINNSIVYKVIAYTILCIIVTCLFYYYTYYIWCLFINLYLYNRFIFTLENN